MMEQSIISLRPYAWCVALAYCVSTQSQAQPMDSGVLQNAMTQRVMMGIAPIEVVDGGTYFSKISATEITRLAVQGGRISKITNFADEIETNKDEVTGQAYVLPTVVNKPISIFITLVSGVTFTLVMQPEPGPARSVLLVERKLQEQSGSSLGTSPRAEASFVAQTHEQSIQALIIAAASGRLEQGMENKTVDQAVGLWKDTKFIHQRTLSGQFMAVDVFSLQNSSQIPMRMVEQELYRQGVVAVSIEQHLLAPGDTTTVYVVRVVGE